MHEQAKTVIVTGGAFGAHDEAPRRFAPGRVRAHSNCDTRLSIYNESNYCSLHRLGAVRRRIRAKTTP